MKVNIIPHPTHPGHYYVEYRPDGAKGRREREPYDNYKAATARKRELERDRAADPSTIHPRIKTVYEDYLKWVELNQAPATHKNKEIVFKSVIIPHFGRYRVKELTQSIYDAFQEKLKGKKRAFNLYCSYLGGMITWMVKRGMAKAMDFKPERQSYHRPRKIIPHPTDLDAIIAAIDDEPKRIMLELMLLTGIRWNEVANIRWENVNLKAGQIRLNESEQEANDLIVIPDTLKKWFKSKRTFQGYVFPNPLTVTDKKPGGEPYKSIRKALSTACKKAGVRITPHVLRHASATYLYDATGDIYGVQHHLRHKDVKTSQIYTQFSTARKRVGQEALIVHMADLKRIEKTMGKVKPAKNGQSGKTRKAAPKA